MLTTLKKLAFWIEMLSDKSGKLISWLTTFMVILICIDVLQRYLFNYSKNWILELEWHLFALVFLIGAAYTLKEDKHVRVDLFYSNFSKKKKAWVDLIGTLFFLLPWCILIIVKSYDYALNSFSFKEGSPNPGGLPALYIIKFCIVIGFVLLLLQGIAVMIKSILTLLDKNTSED
jgi:TRAP-type mannitol/chloroaromatic compound transport system permease small subunit